MDFSEVFNKICIPKHPIAEIMEAIPPDFFDSAIKVMKGFGSAKIEAQKIEQQKIELERDKIKLEEKVGRNTPLPLVQY